MLLFWCFFNGYAVNLFCREAHVRIMIAMKKNNYLIYPKKKGGGDVVLFFSNGSILRSIHDTRNVLYNGTLQHSFSPISSARNPLYWLALVHFKMKQIHFTTHKGENYMGMKISHYTTFHRFHHCFSGIHKQYRTLYVTFLSINHLHMIFTLATAER